MREETEKRTCIYCTFYVPVYMPNSENGFILNPPVKSLAPQEDSRRVQEGAKPNSRHCPQLRALGLHHEVRTVICDVTKTSAGGFKAAVPFMMPEGSAFEREDCGSISSHENAECLLWAQIAV